MKGLIEGVVVSLEVICDCLKDYGILVYDLNVVDEILVYIDGVDEVDVNLNLIKGGGGVLICEKIIVVVVYKFICIVDSSKKVNVLGDYLLLIEVIFMVCSQVVWEIVKLGGDLVYCEGFVIDNGNIIFDIYYMQIVEFVKLEQQFNNIVGVVINGLFVLCSVDILLFGSEIGVQIII